MNKLKALLVFALFSASAHAGNWTMGKVKMVELYPDGAIQVQWTGLNTEKCGTATSGVPVVIRATPTSVVTDAVVNRAYSGLLLAMTSQKPVRFYLQGCDVTGSTFAKVVQFCTTETCI